MAPMVLDEATIDQVEAKTIADIEESEELVFNTPFRSDQYAGDLSNGGQVGAATLYPMEQGIRQKQGRPVARHAYRWDGAESLLPLSWNPEGTHHDAALKYFRKRHCEVCGESGFTVTARTGNRCPRGHSGKGVIVACYYLKFEDVPHKIQRYGKVDCFLVSCVRRGTYGFIDEAAMRMHAGMKHTRQYQAYQEAQRSSDGSEVKELRQRLDNMMMLLAQNGQALVIPPTPVAVVEQPAPSDNVDRSAVARENALKGWEKRRAKQGALSK